MALSIYSLNFYTINTNVLPNDHTLHTIYHIFKVYTLHTIIYHIFKVYFLHNKTHIIQGNNHNLHPWVVPRL